MGKSKIKKAAISFAFVIIAILSVKCLSKYISIYMLEHKEEEKIREMEQNLFPDVLPDLQTQYTHIDNPSAKPHANTDTDIWKKNPDSSKIAGQNRNWTGDCILSIPDIELKKIVYTGTDRMEHLAQYSLVTASDTMKYINGGNYIICGHASRLYGHALNRIREIKKGNRLYIETSHGKDCYIVQQIKYEKMKETSRYCNQTSQRQITIISCAKYVSKESYIVITAIPE